MTRDEAFEALAQYRAGELSLEKRDQFFAELLDNQELYNTFAEQQIFSDFLADPGVRRDAELVLRPSRRQSDRLRRPSWMWAVGLAAVGALLLTIAIDLRLQKRPTSRAEIVERKPPPALHNNPPNPAAVPNADLGANSQPQPHIGRPKTSQAQSDIFAFVLMPTERGEGSENILRLSPAIKTILLEVPIEANSVQHYSATLAAAGGENIRTFNAIAPARLRGGQSGLRIRVASKLVPDGDYILTFSTVDQDGTEESAGGYSFRVIRQQ